MQQIKTYISAKLEHAAKLAAIHADGFHFNARWVEWATGSKRVKPVTHWQQENFDDIVAAHFCLVYVEPADDMKGSIGEAHFATAKDKLVWIAGNAKPKLDKAQPGDEWGVLVTPPGAEQPIRVPNKAVLPWGLNRSRFRIVSGIDQALHEMRQVAAQAKLLDAAGKPIPPLRFEDITDVAA